MVVSGTEAPALSTWFDPAILLPPTRAALWRMTDGETKSPHVHVSPNWR
jgi:hypothetical protein